MFLEFYETSEFLHYDLYTQVKKNTTAITLFNRLAYPIIYIYICAQILKLTL